MIIKEMYKNQAKQLIKCKFRVYGVGNFDIENDELPMILQLANKKKSTQLKKLYDALSRIRLGNVL